MDAPREQYTTQDWVLGFLAYAAICVALVVLNQLGKTYLPPMPWLERLAPGLTAAAALIMIRDRFFSSRRR
jgi:hypothetical protein